MCLSFFTLLLLKTRTLNHIKGMDPARHHRHHNRQFCLIMDSMNSSSLSGTCDRHMNVSEAYDFQRSNFEKVFLGVVSPSIMVLGLTFNGAFLLVLCRVKDMQTLTNVYLGNLAVADIYLLIFGGVLKIITYINSLSIT